jgi:hypothetical protein
MKRDRLFFIKAHFAEQGKNYYCPGCAEMTGLRKYYPALKQRIEVRWVDFARPRPELVALLADDNQSCPVLVLNSVPPELPARPKVQRTNGHAFVTGVREIGESLAHVHGIGLPH